MSGYNNGKTAQEVAETIAENRHLSDNHKVKCAKSETRRRIESLLEEMKLDSDEIELHGVNYSNIDHRYTSSNQLASARSNAKKSTFVRFII